MFGRLKFKQSEECGRRKNDNVPKALTKKEDVGAPALHERDECSKQNESEFRSTVVNCERWLELKSYRLLGDFSVKLFLSLKIGGTMGQTKQRKTISK